MKLSEYITTNRKRLGWSQREMSRKCGISNQTISLLEKGTNPSTGKQINPDPATIFAIAKGFGVSVHDMLREVDDLYIDLSLAFPTETRPIHPEVMSLFDKRISYGEARCVMKEEEQIDPEEADIATLISAFRSLSKEGKDYLLKQAKFAQAEFGTDD